MNRFLLALFLLSILLIPVAYVVSKTLAGLMSILADVILLVTLVQFLSHYENRKYKGMNVEFITFLRHHVLRTYLKHKNVWIVFDRDKKRFRPARFIDFPIKVGVTGLFGTVLLYVSYLIVMAMTYSSSFFWFRSLTLFAIGLMGVYSVFVSGARLAAFQSRESIKLSNSLNKIRSLKNFASKKEHKFEISPNFLLPNGFVTSVEFLSKKTMNKKKLEKTLVDASKAVNRAR